MNKSIILIAILLNCSIFILASCAVNKDFQVTTSDTETLRTRGHMASVDELKQGYKLYVNKCSGCHNLVMPSKYTKSQWELTYLYPEFTKAKVDSDNEKKLISYFIYSKSK